MSIFEQNEIVVISEAPLNYTAYIKMDQFLEATKTLIKTQKSSKGEDQIYFVDCPNASKHGSDSDTSTMIFCTRGRRTLYFCAIIHLAKISLSPILLPTIRT